MVDTSMNPTGQKNTASASVASAPAAPKVTSAQPVAGSPAPSAEGRTVSNAAAPEAAAKQPANQLAAPIVSKVSGLATYRDSESGRLVIQIFDQKRGDVILEFPTENMLRAYPNTSSQPAINHVVETKA